MSGIAGILHLDGRPVDTADLERMRNAMATRAADGAWVWRDGAVGLVHAMLWTTPEAYGHTRPVTDAAGDLVITADARIDNRAELAPMLADDDPPPAHPGDAALILKAYRRWGEDCLLRLVGDFAFALWDRRRRTLFCARDHFGVKPFYYYRSPHLFAFASAPGPLLRIAGVPTTINDARVADYLVGDLEVIDHTSTFYRHVLRLPPAHAVAVDREDAPARRYWALDPKPEIGLRSDGEYVEAFLAVFSEAVACRLRGPGDVGSTLSGGLDSSSVVAVARQWLRARGGPRLHTFSEARPDDPACAETRLIRIMLETMPELVPHLIRPEAAAPHVAQMDRVLAQLDDLFDTSLIYTSLPIFAMVHAQRIKVLLGGMDGDLVTSPQEHYLAYLLRQGAWRAAWVEAKGYSDFFQPHYGVGTPFQLLFRHARTAFVPGAASRLASRLPWRRRRRFDALVADRLIDVDFARQVDLEARLATLGRNLHPVVPRCMREHRAHTLSAPFITTALEKGDRVASAFGIERRHPFFDKRLVELCLALPWRQTTDRGQPKFILRRAMAGVLPEPVRRSGKVRGHRGESAVAALWLATKTDVLEQLAIEPPEGVRPYLNGSRLRELYARYRSGEAAERDRFQLFQAVNLCLWYCRIKRL